MKQEKLRVPTLLLAVWMLIVALPMTCFAESSTPLFDLQEQTPQLVEQKETKSENEDELIPVVDTEELPLEKVVAMSYEKTVPNSESISVSLDTNKIKEYNIDADGLSIVSSSTDAGDIEFYALEEFGVLTLGCEFDDGTQSQYKLYTYKTDSQTYISEVSLDMAWHSAMNDLLEAGEISQFEYELRYGELIRNYTLSETIQGDTTMARATGTYELSGTISFRNSENNAFPLKRAKIALYSLSDSAYTYEMETYTDDTGYYSFSINRTAIDDVTHFCLRIYPMSEVTTVRVSPVSTTLDLLTLQNTTVNYIETAKILYNKNASSQSLGYVMSYNENLSTTATMYIHQGMVMGEIFAENMGTSFDNASLTVYYPLLLVNSFAYYNISGIANGEFANFDTILHEYGHFVAQTKGVYGPSLGELFGQNGLIHYYDSDHFEDIATTEFARELTWSEAWASAFAMIVQDYFKDEYLFYKYDDSNNAQQYYADDKFSIWGINSYNPTIATAGIYACEAQEWAVTAVLYDFYDQDTDEAYDTLKLGYSKWFQYTTRPGMCTLADFVNYIFAEKSQYFAKMANILKHYWISPSVNVVNLPYVTRTNPPYITYEPQGSEDNPNGCIVAIYDEEWQCYYWRNIPSDARDYTQRYLIDKDAWRELCKLYSGRQSLYLVVLGYKQGESSTYALYPSNLVEISLDYDASLNIASTETFGEIKVGIFAGATESIYMTFSKPGPVVIQTMGGMDVMMEIVNKDTGVVLKTFDQTNDEGHGTNAYHDFYPTVGDEYEIKIKNYYVIASGRTKLVWFYRENNFYMSASPTNYDNMLTLTYSAASSSCSVSNATYGVNLQALRFEVERTGEYELSVASNDSSTLIVLDPNSNKLSYEGIDMKIETTPCLTCYFTSGKEYLILYGSTSASSAQNQTPLTLYIHPAN